VIYNFRPIGLAVDYSSDIVINHNVMIKVVERDTLEAEPSYVDRKAGFSICTLYWSIVSCSNITVNYNIAAGITMAGFVAIA
jgi:lipopolysaccharide biosynthesis regulator YciM